LTGREDALLPLRDAARVRSVTEDTTQATIRDLATLLSPYNPAHVLAAVGALSLMPENAARAVRLETLAYAALASPDRLGTTAIDGPRLRRLLNAGTLARRAIVGREDPPEDSYTEEFAFYDGSYLLLPGSVEESSFTLRHLCAAIFLAPEPFPDAGFRRRASDLVMGALALSDAVARRAGLARGLEPDSPVPGRIVVPSDDRLATLARAATLDREEYAAILVARGLPPGTLDPLTIPLGALVAGDDGVGDARIDITALHATPIVAAGDARIVALPGLLPVAARHALLRLATARGVAGDLMRRYALAAWGTVVESLEGMGIRPVCALSGLPDSPGTLDGAFLLDNDKLLYALLIADEGAAYDPGTAYSPWPVEGLAARVERRVRAAHEAIGRAPSPPRAILSLVLIQGVGRPVDLRFEGLPDTPTHPTLVMTAADLQTIALLERDDPLALWYHEHAAMRARRQAAVIVVGALDEYHAYRAGGYMYPPTADDAPHALCIRPGGAGELRREVRRARDWHGAPFGEGVIEVTTAYDNPLQPIYTPTSTGGRRLAFLVEGLPLPLWVVSPPVDDGVRSLMDRYIAFADAVAYWMWQCTPSLGPLLRPLAATHACAYILLDLPVDEWDAPGPHRDPGPDAPPHPAIAATADPGRGMLTLTVRPTAQSLMDGPGNEGERALLRTTLSGLRDLLPPGAGAAWPDGALAAIVDRHAPAGIKKRLIVSDDLSEPDLDRRGVPRPRTIRQAPVQAARHDTWPRIRSWMATDARAGHAPKERWVALLDDLVAAHYGELERVVASLDPGGLLETLVARHEALVAERASRRLSIPTISAGLADVPHVLRGEWAGLHDLDRAAVAARFAIEYAVARPPSGTASMSIEAYDRLLALASLVAETGVEADLIRHDLIAVGPAPLSPREMSERRRTHDAAVRAYGEAYVHGETARMTRAFAGRWDARAAGDGGDDTGFIARVDAATRAEWGVALTEILDLMGALEAIGQDVDPVCPSLPRDELCNRLAARLAWPRARVGATLDLLSLGPRADFLAPSPPHRRRDVYPWRYNRALSYLRRPLLRRDGARGVEVLWGPRHLYAARHYLVGLVASGRLEGASADWRRLKGTIVHGRGEAFNDAVTDLLGTIPPLAVRSRVPVADGGRDLGDIDVLVVDPRRRRFWAIECKDFSAGRMPHELQGEMGKLFVGEGGKPSSVEKHARRVAWARAHVADVARQFNIEDTTGWVVDGLIVVDQELLTPYVRQSPVRVVPFEQIAALFAPA